ncbi:hypothetical protein CTAYLR_007094 [Chrysophaeum taylorii]|uniref:Choline transporter-like protein n=1 Tax=Chrysophaeum taylorii TaxID=2483200 RepID=A0AAD7ULI7_9STRA|nr:hypothetical protein CTAYLR_007094 [Chrysophaeum taylorii]
MLEDEAKEAAAADGAAFTILRNSEEIADVLSQAGEVSRLASDRLLDEEDKSEDLEGDQGAEMHPMMQLTSESISPLCRPIGDGALRPPKAARDAKMRALFVAHCVASFFAPAAWFAAAGESPARGIASWVPTGSTLLVASPLCAATFAALFACLVVAPEPREARIAVARLAYPTALCALAAVAAVVTVASLTDADFVVVGVSSCVPLVSGARAAAAAKRSRGAEPFFDAMLAIVAKFFATARGPVLQLVFVALALQGAHLAAWSAARSDVRRHYCEKSGRDRGGGGAAYVAVEIVLLFSLYWTTQVIRTLVRAVVSGCAMHYLVRVGALEAPATATNGRPTPTNGRRDGYSHHHSGQRRRQEDERRRQEDEDADVDDLLLAHDEALADVANPVALDSRRRGEATSRDDDRARAHRKELIAAARRAESFFIGIALTTSAGSVCRGALACPLAEMVRGLVDLLAASPACRCCARTTIAKAASATRDLAFVHVALHNKAFSSAAHDVARVVDESGVADLLASDPVVPILQTYRSAAGAFAAAFFTALALIHHHGTHDPTVDCQDANLLLLHFVFGFVCFALAIEPVVATLEVFYLGFAQAPQGLASADPIVYRRFARILNRDHAPRVNERVLRPVVAKQQQKNRPHRQEVSL